MRVIFTGQIGLNKGPYIEEVAKLAKHNKKEVEIFHTGKLMYKKDKSITRGRILNLPFKQQNLLSDSIFQDIIQRSKTVKKDIVINTHATFRWFYGLFRALNLELIKKFRPDILITLVDDVDVVKLNLTKRKFYPPFTLKDIMVWREEEILASDLLASLLKIDYYIIPMEHSPEVIYKLLYERRLKKVYTSFPISHIQDQPELLREIDQFKKIIQDRFVAFDPHTIKEKRLDYLLEDIPPQAENINIKVRGKKFVLSVKEIRDIITDMDGQITSRDFKMIEQSDMIISYIPEFANRPLIAQGVERELQHAYDTTKEVYIIWTSKKGEPSPLAKTSATKIFPSISAALEYFKKEKPRKR